MAFMFKNTSTVALQLCFEEDSETVPPGAVAGPFKDEHLTENFAFNIQDYGVTFPAPEAAAANGSEPAEPVELEQPEDEPPPASDDDETETEPENTIE